MYHWAELIAEKAITERKGKQVIATGTSLSGEPHIGNANDVIRGYAVYKSLLKKNVDASIIWIADDMDPFRSVPAGFPTEFYNYLGMPVSSVPDPNSCHKSLVSHYEEAFLNEINSLQINGLQPYFGIELYKNGKYDGTKLIAMRQRAEIRAILMRVTGAELPTDWYPVDVICPKCGKISTTKILGYNSDKNTLNVECLDKEILLHKKNPVKGCGYSGEVSLMGAGAKLTWRVEWPARWSFLNVTIEPFGKEHAAAGGSYDTGKKIVPLFNWQPPIPVVYEHYQMAGEKMSKSKGNVVTVSELLKLISPEELKFYMYFERIEKARNIDLSTLPPFIADEYDRAERVYFKKEECRDEKEMEKKIVSYALANEKITDNITLPFQFASLLVQIYPENEIANILKKSGYISGEITEESMKRINERIKRSKYWIQEYAPENKKIKLNNNPTITVNDAEKQIFKKIANLLREKSEWNGEELQTAIFQIIKESGLPPKQIFSQLYQLFISRNEGPKIGPFISFMDKNYVLKMLENVV